MVGGPKIERWGSSAHLGPGARTIRRSLKGWTCVPVGLFVGMTVVYLAVRLPLWNGRSPVLSSLLLAAELFGEATSRVEGFTS